MSSRLVISLDFEMFWGVAASRSLAQYGPHVQGEWEAIPLMLNVFRQRGMRATWATVGMLMCKDFAQWQDIRPAVLPSYEALPGSSYDLGAVARENPSLFFGRPLVEKIIETPGQELGSHSYSHLYCSDRGVTAAQFAADLGCATEIFQELGLHPRSFVFPRNQVRQEFLGALKTAGYRVYRGNPSHWLYANGHQTRFGLLGRAIRLADAYLPISSDSSATPEGAGGLTNCPASYFLRPYSIRAGGLHRFHLLRLKKAMETAAKQGGVFHLWWHPHNFGLNVRENVAGLEDLLNYFMTLRDRYGMESSTMADCQPYPEEDSGKAFGPKI